MNKEKWQKIRKEYGVLLLIILCSMLMLAFQGAMKSDYHEDEIMTYALSNSALHGKFIPDTGEKLHAKDAFMEALSVHEGRQFAYKRVFMNQREDVHPPLYYLLIHTICSLNPDTFSPWVGIGVNMFFMLLSIIVFYRCAAIFLKNRYYVNILTAFFALCPAVMEIDVFIRMYAMAIFLCLSVLYWMLLHLEDGKEKWTDYLILFLAVTAGALTHYYCIMFTVLFSITYGVIQLKRNAYKHLLFFSVTMIAAAAASITIFPSMIFHIFFGYRGTEAFANVMHVYDVFYRFMVYTWMIASEIFGGMLFVLLIWMIAINKRKKQQVRETMQELGRVKWFFIAIPTLIYFILVAKTSAYVEPRYISLIYACLILCAGSFFLSFVEKSMDAGKGKRVVGICMACILVLSYFFCDFEYSYINAENLKLADQYKNLDSVFIYDDYDQSWRIDRNYKELTGYQSTMFLTAPEEHKLAKSDFAGEKEFIVYIAMSTEERRQEIREDVFTFCKGVNACDLLYSEKDTEMYRFYAR